MWVRLNWNAIKSRIKFFHFFNFGAFKFKKTNYQRYILCIIFACGVIKSTSCKTFIKPSNAEVCVNQVRLTVDYDEDLEFYRQLFKHVSYLEESDILLKEIILRNLGKINWFRHLEFQKNQENFNNSVI